ncbi:MAG: hypothetical protein IH588_06935, partial [Anaerolineales bacterium]|nr:hypothetical protein [Anaerolineales bacterium]
MNTPYLETVQTQEGWQTTFAFQVFHRPADEWMAMRWGFNAGALLDEALDRYRLFIESQALSEGAYLSNEQPADRTLTLRGINLPNEGLQMALLGKSTAPEKAQAQQAAKDYAREIFSIFPHDFITQPAEEKADYDRLFGRELFAKNPQVASIQRAMVFIPPMEKYQYFSGIWQTSQRANEQVWRALSNTQNTTMLNITIQPSILHEGEKEMLLDAKKMIADILAADAHAGKDIHQKENTFSAHLAWADAHIKRQLSPWKKFFQVQIHVLANGAVDENLLRSIGATVTRDTNENSIPGFQVLRPQSKEEEKEWCE